MKMKMDWLKLHKKHKITSFPGRARISIPWSFYSKPFKTVDERFGRFGTEQRRKRFK